MFQDAKAILEHVMNGSLLVLLMSRKIHELSESEPKIFKRLQAKPFSSSLFFKHVNTLILHYKKVNMRLIDLCNLL